MPCSTVTPATGPITLRWALAHSRNAATIEVAEELGVDTVIEMARRLGIRSPLQRTLGLALGNSGVTLIELVRLVCEFTGRRRWVIGLPDALSMLQAWFLEWTPGPLMSRDNVRSMQVPSVCDCALPFGIEPTPLEAVAPGYLRGQFTARSRYRLLRWRARR